ncbi:MAG TPA: ATP-binding protein [Gaiellaceae bacterium]
MSLSRTGALRETCRDAASASLSRRVPGDRGRRQPARSGFPVRPRGAANGLCDIDDRYGCVRPAAPGGGSGRSGPARSRGDLRALARAHGAPSPVRARVGRPDRGAGRPLRVGTEPEEITISADGRRVRQVVFNLVSNAVKFTPAESRVGVSARLDDGQVEIAVTDTGPGIAPEELETIFEEFKQATDGKRAEGTGLGLPLSRKLVELHGGRLWVESAAGDGSTFRFTLPVGPTGPASVQVN